MHRLRHVLIFITLGLVTAYGAYLGYLARLNYTGYCHAAGKFLTDDEKIRMAVADVLKTYPPAVIRTPVVTDGLQFTRRPANPIYYRDVDDFLRRNPNCCHVSLSDEGSESYEPGYLWRIVGATSGFVIVNYLVRYLDEDSTPQSKKIKATIPISNCGKPVNWTSPLDSDLFFIIKFIENKDTL